MSKIRKHWPIEDISKLLIVCESKEGMFGVRCWAWRGFGDTSRLAGARSLTATLPPPRLTDPRRDGVPSRRKCGVELGKGATSPGNQPRGWAGLTISPPPSRGYLKCHLLSHVADGIRPVNLIEPRIYQHKPSKQQDFTIPTRFWET